jgi:hypothetical protein
VTIQIFHGCDQEGLLVEQHVCEQRQRSFLSDTAATRTQCSMLLASSTGAMCAHLTTLGLQQHMLALPCTVTVWMA